MIIVSIYRIFIYVRYLVECFLYIIVLYELNDLKRYDYNEIILLKVKVNVK